MCGAEWLLGRSRRPKTDDEIQHANILKDEVSAPMHHEEKAHPTLKHRDRLVAGQVLEDGMIRR